MKKLLILGLYIIIMVVILSYTPFVIEAMIISMILFVYLVVRTIIRTIKEMRDDE